jgi:hypothetical protein
MRQLLAGLLTCLVSVGFAQVAQAQQDVKITDVRVGFSKGNDDYFKVGSWVPVYVDIEVLDQDFHDGRLFVEAADGDGVGTVYILPDTPGVFVSKSEKTRTFVSYIKIGSGTGDVDVTIKGYYGTRYVERRFHYPEQRVPYVPVMPLPLRAVMVLGIGLPKGIEQGPSESLTTDPLAGPSLRVAFQTELAKLPEHWYGYDSVDVVVLPTGGNWQGSIAQQLMLDEKRRQALEQWVQMGGHLIVSVSGNVTMVANAKSFPLEPMLPAEIDPESTVKVDRLSSVRDLITKKTQEVASLGPVELTRLKPRQLSRILATEPGPGLPSIVQGPYGLGKVTLLGFDTDQGAFMGWANNHDFWMGLLDVRLDTPQQLQPWQRNQWMGMENNDLATQLCNQLDFFGEVKVIPFWWVAIFIFIYIIIVGPLDYLILKKLMKSVTGQERMEWTWLTFPTVVLVVSVGAYYLAHYLKGDELRINKVDLVDIDLDPRTQRMYGNSWFTIFSPRLQHYNLGMQSVGFDGQAEANNISWMGRPGDSMRSLNRRSSGGLFQRTYEYRDDAHRLEGVPIHVWSMKSFTNRWDAPLDKSKLPVKFDLKVKQKLLSGKVTSQMPWNLRSAQLVYLDHVWDLGPIKAGETVEVPKDRKDFGSMEAQFGWRQGSYSDILRRMMFFKRIPRSGQEANDYLEYLDQSWRLQYPTQAILIGALDEADGQAAEINDSGRLGCKFGTFDPKLRGTMRQSTLVRVYLPIQRETE